MITGFIGFAEPDNPCNLNDNVEIMKRHYKLLEREMNKKKPNVEIVNAYLNKQFNARREWLKIIPAEERCQKILKDYPCFTDHVEVQYKIWHQNLNLGKFHVFWLSSYIYVEFMKYLSTNVVYLTAFDKKNALKVITKIWLM